MVVSHKLGIDWQGESSRQLGRPSEGHSNTILDTQLRDRTTLVSSVNEVGHQLIAELEQTNLLVKRRN